MSLPEPHPDARESSTLGSRSSDVDEERTINGNEEKVNDQEIDQNEQDERNRVDWDPNDPLNPQNWSTLYKSWLTFQLGMLALAASLASSITAPANQVLAEYVGVSEEVIVLTVSLYVLGFAVGPLAWAPISEIWGRRISLLPALFGLGLFSIGTATSQNATAVFLTRFFGGVFGSGPVSNVSAALGDIWSREVRGTAVSLYAIAVVGGPTLGPVIGSALVVSPGLGWRWTEYLTAIFTFAVCAMGSFFLPEVYGPVILKRKAKALRKETGNEKLWHPQERIKLDPKSIITKQFSRPLKMVFTEPMVTCICLYASFVFSILYMTLEVFPIVFEEERHYKPVIASLFFLGLFVGCCVALLLNIGNQPHYIRVSRRAGGKPVPEARCPPMLLGGLFFVIGLFWFGWTASPGHHWINPAIAAVFIGAGFNVVFQQCLNFLVDTYGLYSASAVAANTFLRSIMAAGLPLAARPMFHNLGVGPAMSILGGVAVIALPVPLLFMKFGVMLRKRSKFAPLKE